MKSACWIYYSRLLILLILTVTEIQMARGLVQDETGIPFNASLVYKSDYKDRCNLRSLLLKFSSNDINVHLTEVSRQILHVENIERVMNVPSHQWPCLYQHVFLHKRMIQVVLTVNNANISGYISIGEDTYEVPNQRLTRAGVLRLSPYLSHQVQRWQCSVRPKYHATHEFNLLRRKRDLSYYYVPQAQFDKYVELYVIGDYFLYNKRGVNTVPYLLEVVNIVNSMYRSFGVHVITTGMEVWTDSQKILWTNDSDNALTLITAYRQVSVTVAHDNLHFVSGLKYQDNYAGKAYLGGFCKFTSSSGLTSDEGTANSMEAASIFAHEMGHNFGLIHDTAGCTCSPDAFCVMTGEGGTIVPFRWSSCSVTQLMTSLNSGVSYCLDNVPQLYYKVTATSSSCGNGIVETGEDCDPGIVVPTSNQNVTSCCNPATCKFTNPNATCASGRCCDLGTCQPLLSGTVCAPVKSECDLPEYCNGLTSMCPTDVYKIDGTSCDSGSGYCYGGQCGSSNKRCQQLFGPTFTSALDICYQQNTVGSAASGYCNYVVQSVVYNVTNYVYTPCAASNVLCGSLHCSSPNNYAPNADKIWQSLETYNYFSVGDLTCYHAFHNVNLTGYRDPGLAPNGVACGANKLCIASNCVSLSTLPACKGCSGHGVCNNMGNCHCDSGYNGSSCAQAGCGGSVDSGPPPKCTIQVANNTLAISLGIVGSILFIGLVVLAAFLIKKRLVTPRKSTGPPPSISVVEQYGIQAQKV